MVKLQEFPYKTNTFDIYVSCKVEGTVCLEVTNIVCPNRYEIHSSL